VVRRPGTYRARLRRARGIRIQPLIALLLADPRQDLPVSSAPDTGARSLGDEVFVATAGARGGEADPRGGPPSRGPVSVTAAIANASSSSAPTATTTRRARTGRRSTAASSRPVTPLQGPPPRAARTPSPALPARSQTTGPHTPRYGPAPSTPRRRSPRCSPPLQPKARTGQPAATSCCCAVGDQPRGDL
jgi:hypothetical protein